MAVPKHPPRIVEPDLEATAELPIVEFDDAATADLHALSEAAVATDVFPTPVVPVGVADLADSLRDVEHRLQRKIERVSKLETELANAQQQAGELRAQLEQAQRTSVERESSLRAEIASAAQREADQLRESMAQSGALAEARAQLQVQYAALTDSQQQAQQRANLQRAHERDLLELRQRSERQHEALSSWQGFRAVSESLLADSEARLRGVDERHAAELQNEQAQCSRLQEYLTTARQAAAGQVAAVTQSLLQAEQAQQASAEELQATAGRVTQLSAELAASQSSATRAQQQLDELRALEEKARLGAAQFDELQQQIAILRDELDAASQRLSEAQTQLRVSAERVRRLESDAHASAAVLGNLQQNMERLGRDDTGSRPALQPVPAEIALRVLIRLEGGAEIVYPLSRRTSVGRTAENDIQVDTTFISRYHAVLLSNPDHCIVEDLNSTNGVLVNGRRVGRQILQDGDAVTVGRTEFRYQQRS